MTKENILEKVRKILAIAEKSNFAEEAEIAMLKAQQLLVEHGLSLSDVSEEAIEKNVVTLDADELGQKVHWRGLLSVIVGSNFRCVPYWNGWGNHYRLRFIGLETDAQVAKQVYQAARDAVEKLVRKHLDERKKEYRRSLTISEAMRIRSSFVGGFLDELREKFREQVAEQCWALALVPDEAVTERVEQMKLKNGERSQAQLSGDLLAFREGFKAGKEF